MADPANGTGHGDTRAMTETDRQAFFEQTCRGDFQPTYGRWFAPFARFSLHRETAVAALLVGGKRFLDVGCGIGTLARSVADRYADVHGVDIAPSRVQEANRQAAASGMAATFVVADVAMGLPYPDEYFDALTCVATLPFIPADPHAVMREFHRLLAPGGVCIVQAPNIAFIVHRLRLLCGTFPVTSKQIGWDGGACHYFTVRSLTRLCETTGFHVTARANSGVFARPRRAWLTMLSSDVIVTAVRR